MKTIVESLREKASLWLGLGFTLAWIFTILSFEGIIRTSEPGYFIGYVHDPLLEACTLITAAGLLITSYLPLNTLQYLFQTKRTRFILAATVLALIAILLPTVVFPLSRRIALVSGGILGLSLTYMLLGWLNYFSELDLGDAPVIVVAAFAVSAVLAALCVSVSMADITLAIYLNLAYLCISAVLLLGYRGHFPLPPAGQQSWKALVGPVIFAFVVGFIVEFSWTYYLKGSSSYSSTGFTTDYLSSALLAAVIMLPFAGMARRAGYKLSRAYSLTILLIVVSLGLNIFAEEIVYWAYGANQVVYYLTQMMVWLTAIAITFKLSDTPFRVGGRILGSMYLGLFAGFISCTLLANYLRTSPDLSTACNVVMIVVIVFVALFVFREYDFVRLISRPTIPDSPAQPADSVTEVPESATRKQPDKGSATEEHVDDFDQRLLQIARDAKLSKRETEVFLDLARGRNAVFIQEKLVLSYSTISTHRQNIYAKINVHNQQELLDYVERHLH